MASGKAGAVHFGVSRAFLWMSIRSSWGITEASQPQLPASGPRGQPIESAQLVGRVTTVCNAPTLSYQRKRYPDLRLRWPWIPASPGNDRVPLDRVRRSFSLIEACDYELVSRQSVPSSLLRGPLSRDAGREFGIE